MKQKNKTRLARAAMTLLFALLATVGAWAQTTVTIGNLENAENDSYLPMNSLYEYSYTQQIYTADEIGMAGTITSITLWLYGNANLYEMPFDIYMVEVDKEAFTGNTDWVAVSASNIVYSGSITVHNTTAEAYTFTLETPFQYSGNGNLVICFNNTTGQWKSGLNGMVFSVENAPIRAIYARRDGNGYDPTNLSGVSAYGTTAKRNVIEIGITPSSGPTCAKPETLEVSDITGYGATLTWTSEVGNYTFEYKKASASDWTVVTGLTATSYALSNLESNTAYNVRVKAVCGAGLESGYKTANFTTLDVCPDGKVCIGSGTATNSYIPTYTYYNYSLTQQIYTAAELGEDGYILSVDFHSSAAQTRTLDIYMVSTDKNSFESANDWIPVTAADKVFSGSVTFAANDWTTIEFDTPFDYDGRSNVALIVDDNTGSYVSSPSFYAFSATSQAIRVYSDETNYNPESPSSYNGTVLPQKNRVRFAIGEPPSCPKPTNLTAGTPDAHSVELSWTENGEATQWQICINDDETNLIDVNENPYTLTNLVPETAYSVKVRAYCSAEDQSSWSDVVTFTTGIANPAPTDVLADNVTSTSADISWTGNNDATSYNLRYRTARGFNYGFETAEPWAIDEFDPCTTYDGDQTQCYGFDGETFTNIPFTGSTIAFQSQGGNLSSHSGNAFGLMINPASSLQAADDWFILPELTINEGDIFSFWGREITSNYGAETINVGIYGDTDGMFAAMIAENVAVNSTTWTEYSYDLSAYVGQTIRLAVNCVSLDVFGFMIDDIFVGNPNDDTWDVTLTNVTSPNELTGLTPSTDYEVQVQAVYADGSSQWVGTSFTTDVEFAAPENLEMTDISTTEATVSWTAPSATVTGYVYQYKKASAEEWSTEATITETSVELSGLDSGTPYNFRVKAVYDGGSSTFAKINFTTDCLPKDLPYSYGFEETNELNCWSLLSANSENMLGISLYDAAYEGNNVFVFSSYNSASNYDQYLISPTLNATSPVAVEFYYRTPQGNGSGETFVVGYSTTTADPDEFTWGEEISTNTTEWTPYTDVFPAGTKYVAIYYYSDYQYYLLVDDFSITESKTNILFAKEGYATYYNSGYDVVLPAGMKAKIVTASASDGTLTYETIADGSGTVKNVPSKTAVMLQVAPAADNQTIFVDLATATTGTYTGNKLHGSDTQTTTTGDTGDDLFYKLSYDLDGKNIGWYWGEAGGAAFSSGAHKAWLSLSSSVFPPSQGAPFLGLPGWEDTTGIVPVNKGETAENGEWYTLQGLKIGKKPTTAGVYIHNGRKVLIP